MNIVKLLLLCQNKY